MPVVRFQLKDFTFGSCATQAGMSSQLVAT
jgi:hypothetical protein